MLRQYKQSRFPNNQCFSYQKRASKVNKTSTEEVKRKKKKNLKISKKKKILEAEINRKEKMVVLTTPRIGLLIEMIQLYKYSKKLFKIYQMLTK